MPVNLTPNAIASINGGDMNSKPLVQVMDIKLIGSTQERYGFLISDLVSTQHAMLGTQLNDRVKTGQVKKGSVVQLIEYICSTVQNRRIIVVLNMETFILDSEIFGNPKMFTESESTTQRAILTPNAIASIIGGDMNSKPLVQVMDIKLIGSTQERYRFLISDSVSTQHAMLATQLNDRVKTGQVKKGSIVQLIDYICSTVQNRKIIVVLNMETIILDSEIIGNPKMFIESESTTERAIPNGNSEHPMRINNFSAPNPSTYNAPNLGTFSTPNSSTRTPKGQHFDKLSNIMLIVADMASNNEEDSNMLMEFMIDMRKKLEQKESEGGLGRKVNISSTINLRSKDGNSPPKEGNSLITSP